MGVWGPAFMAEGFSDEVQGSGLIGALEEADAADKSGGGQGGWPLWTNLTAEEGLRLRVKG